MIVAISHYLLYALCVGIRRTNKKTSIIKGVVYLYISPTPINHPISTSSLLPPGGSSNNWLRATINQALISVANLIESSVGDEQLRAALLLMELKGKEVCSYPYPQDMYL